MSVICKLATIVCVPHASALSLARSGTKTVTRWALPHHAANSKGTSAARSVSGWSRATLIR